MIYRQGRKPKSKPSSTHKVVFFLGEEKTEEQQGVQTLAVTEGLVALYAEELLLDQFEFLNDYRQLVLQENKKLEDERVQDVN
jgi:hypothetical protein